jgi:hypothetical protein
LINHGPGKIDNAYVSVDLSAAYSAISGAPGCNADYVVVCSAGTLAVGASTSFNITWTAASAAGSYRVASDAWSAYGNWVDPNFGNNYVPMSVNVTSTLR